MVLGTSVVALGQLTGLTLGVTGVLSKKRWYSLNAPPTASLNAQRNVATYQFTPIVSRTGAGLTFQLDF
jgi:hypothetical protein